MLAAALGACSGSGSDSPAPEPAPAPLVTAPQVQGLQCSGPVQSGWCWQDPQPTGSRTNSLFYLDAQRAWMVGDAGLIVRTDDSGRTWAVQRSGVDVSLDKVAFADAQRGWAFSSGQAVALYTGDGGQRWTRATALTFSRIGAGWVLADGSAIVSSDTADNTPGSSLRSHDGGASWQAAELWVTHVTPRGTLLGTRGAAWGRSTDQGRSFTPQASVSDGRPLAAVAGDGKTTVWALLGRSNALPGSADYDLQTLYRSDDDGATWHSPVNVDGQLRIERFRLEVDGTGWARYKRRPGRPEPTGPSGFLRTSDGGRSWVEVQVTAPFDPLVSPLQTFLGEAEAGLIDGQTMWVHNGLGAFLTTDRGQSWRYFDGNPANQPPRYAFDATSFERDSTGALVMKVNGAGLQRSVDQGQTWARLLGPRTNDTVDGLWFFDAQRGLALGLNGTLFDTADGGLHWQMRDTRVSPDDSTVNRPPRQLQFSTPTVGWMVAGGRLLRSNDAGYSWAPSSVPSGAADVVAQVQFLSAQVGWVTTQSRTYTPPGPVWPTLLHFTTDGGSTWQTRPVPFEGISAQVAFATAELGLRTDGLTGKQFRTTDGGRSWSPVMFPADAVYVTRLYFADASNAWALSSQFAGSSVLVRSTDGGQTWRSVTTPLGQRVLNIKFLDRQRGWAVGIGGGLMATTDGGDTWALQASGTQEVLSSIFARDADSVWVGGSNGAILATGSGGRSF